MKIFYIFYRKNLRRRFLGEVPLEAVSDGKYAVQTLFYNQKKYIVENNNLKIQSQSDLHYVYN